MFDCTAVVTTLAHPNRIMWMKRTIPEVAKSPIFKRKILAIAESPAHKIQPKDAAEAMKADWELHIDGYRDRIKTFSEVLEKVDTEWIFYHEEDVLMKELPSMVDMEEIDNFMSKDMRKCGALSLNPGGSTHDTPSKNMGDFDQIRENMILETPTLKFFQRNEKNKNDYFISFPALFIRTSILKECHRYATHHCHGMQIETALSQAYFDQAFDRYFFKASAMLPSISDLQPGEILAPHVPYEVLDPRQGQSPNGGKHTY